MMVEQDFWDTLACDAPVEPENVQVVALFPRLGAWVMAGSAMGEHATHPARAANPRWIESLVIVVGIELSFEEVT